MRIIAGGKQLATMSGSVLTLGAAVNDELTIGEATAMAVDGDLVDDSGLDGETVLVRVEYDDPATDGTDFEVGEWTYSSTAGTLTRVATEFSSAGTSAVTFTSTVVVYGVLTSSQVHNNDNRLYQNIVVGLGGLLTDHNSTTLTSAANSYTVTPTKSGTRCSVNFHAGMIFERDNITTGTSHRGKLRMYYKNSSSVWTAFNTQYFGGMYKMPTTDLDFSLDAGLSGTEYLDSGKLNASGNWEIKPYIALVDNNSLVTLRYFRMNIMETEDVTIT